METGKKDIAILLMHCPDQKGIVASVTSFLQENKGNVIYLDQHVDRERNMFFMRLEVELDEFIVPKEKMHDYFQTLIASRYHMTFKLFFKSHVPRMAVFVSKMSHCLFDILSRNQSGEWEIEIPLIVSNHKSLEPIAKSFRIPFEYLPITKENKAEQEIKQIEILEKHDIDLIVLARYMQILSGEFIKAYPDQIINIHHSFLPAFIGAKPYHAAHERGVKIIGATSHYVTEELDAGPIIDQGVTRVSHRDSVKDLIRKGKDLEKIVLSRAIWNHINHKLLHFENRTIIFD